MKKIFTILLTLGFALINSSHAVSADDLQAERKINKRSKKNKRNKRNIFVEASLIGAGALVVTIAAYFAWGADEARTPSNKTNNSNEDQLANTNNSSPKNTNEDQLIVNLNNQQEFTPVSHQIFRKRTNNTDTYYYQHICVRDVDGTSPESEISAEELWFNQRERQRGTLPKS